MISALMRVRVVGLFSSRQYGSDRGGAASGFTVHASSRCPLRIHPFNLADVDWYELNIDRVTEGRPADSPDLSRIEEVGFTDLVRGGGSRASSRLDWIEVYGRPVER